MTNDLRILVCCHKKDYHASGEGFYPIQVGKGLSQVDLGLPGDNTGENISEKNKWYCELTALYWQWKNQPSVSYIGLNHYRRYFLFNSPKILNSSVVSKSMEDIIKNPPEIVGIDEIFSRYDIILPKPLVSQYPLEIQYRVCHIPNDIEILKTTITKLYPEYQEAYNKVMIDGYKFSPYNMFLTRYEIFEDYCKWLFDILFEVERQIKISAYPDQARVLGYMGERLLNIYVVHNHLKVKYLPIIKIEDKKSISPLKEIVANTGKALTAKLLRFASKKQSFV